MAFCPAVRPALGPLPVRGAVGLRLRLGHHLVEKRLLQRDELAVEPVPLRLGHRVVGVGKVLLHVGYLRLRKPVGDGNGEGGRPEGVRPVELAGGAILWRGPVAEPQGAYGAMLGLVIRRAVRFLKRLAIQSFIKRLIRLADMAFGRIFDLRLDAFDGIADVLVLLCAVASHG